MQTDDNGDRKLSLQEMLNHEFIFYNTVHADGHQESDDDHDELWNMNPATFHKSGYKWSSEIVIHDFSVCKSLGELGPEDSLGSRQVLRLKVIHDYVFVKYRTQITQNEIILAVVLNWMHN